MFRNLPFITVIVTLCGSCCLAQTNQPLPIDSLWQSSAFRKAYTGSYGVDSNIEPLIKEDESNHLNQVAKLLENKDRKGAIAKLVGTSLTYQSAAMQFSLANLYFEEDNSAEAIKYFKKTIEQFPNFRDAHRNLAMVYIKEDKSDEAEPHLIRAVELGSREGLTFGLLAHIHSENERYQAALAAYRMAQVTMPKERQWKLGEAYTLHSLEKAGEASTIYGALIKESPAEAMLWINQANAFIQREDYTQAIANLEVVKRMGKLPAANQFFLGQLYLEQGFPKTALDNFKTSITSLEIDLSQATTAMTGLVARSYWESAEAFGKLCDKLYKDEFEKDDKPTLKTVAKYQRAMALLELETGKTQSGVQRVTQLIEKDPLDGEALILLSRFYQAEGEFSKAVDLLEQAGLIQTVRAKALYNHGIILVNHFGEYKDALRLLEQSYQLSAQPSLAAYITELRVFVK